MGRMCYILGHGTIAQENEMADGVERHGGVCDKASAGESSMSVADDFPHSALSTQETVVGVAGKAACSRLALPAPQTSGISMAG
jgi:hypothetical protein